MYSGIQLILKLAWVVVFIYTPLSVAEDSLKKGEYLFQLANCYSCHTDTENDGKALAGGRALDTEFGTFYTPNITPDAETGIGSWTEQHFIQAVRNGISPDGSHYYPSFPYMAYRNINDDDISSIWEYLLSLPPVTQVNKAHQLDWYLFRPALNLWKMLNITQEKVPDRGAYLINTLGHCNECHTPRNALGLLKMDQALTGNKALSAPDISIDALKDWTHEELTDLFIYGALPDGDYVSDHMAEVVEHSTSKWNKHDLQAAIQYLTRP